MVLFAAPAAAQTIVASSASPSTYSGSGQTITFSFTVNSGNRVASSATVTSPKGLVYSCPIADTANTNINFTCTATYTTTGSDAFIGGFVQDQPTVTMMSFSTPSTIAVPAMRSDFVAPDSPPTIILDPLNVVVVAGNNATFDAWGVGTPTPSLQWQVSTDGGGTFNNISGATSDILTFQPGIHRHAEPGKPEPAERVVAAAVMLPRTRLEHQGPEHPLRAFLCGVSRG